MLLMCSRVGYSHSLLRYCVSSSLLLDRIQSKLLEKIDFFDEKLRMITYNSITLMIQQYVASDWQEGKYIGDYIRFCFEKI